MILAGSFTHPSEVQGDLSALIVPEAWPLRLGEREVSEDELLGFLQPYPAALMRAYPVGVRVGSVRNNDAELLSPIAA